MFEVHVVWELNGKVYDTVLSYPYSEEEEVIKADPQSLIDKAVCQGFEPYGVVGYKVHEIYSYDLRKFFI